MTYLFFYRSLRYDDTGYIDPPDSEDLDDDLLGKRALGGLWPIVPRRKDFLWIDDSLVKNYNMDVFNRLWMLNVL